MEKAIAKEEKSKKPAIAKKKVSAMDAIKDTNLKTFLTNLQGQFGVKVSKENIDIAITKNATMTFDKVVKPLSEFGYIIKNVENRWRTTHVFFGIEGKAESA